MSFFQTLAAATASQQRALFEVPQIVDGLTGTISRGTYVAYLGEAYHHVRHTVPLMRLAQLRMGPAHERFRLALETYISEETGHEHWILSDIDNAGGDGRSAAARPPGAATSAMVDYAYETVGRGNPMGLFGMVYVLEGTSVALASRGAGALAGSLGLGPECFRYLTSHGALDQDHMAFFQSLMETVDDPADQTAVIEVARRVFILFADLFRAIPHDRSLRNAI